MNTRFPFADWFRNSSPYINAHRGRTFVILIEGDALSSSRRTQLIQDLALLHTLGVKLVVVFGVRPQVAEALQAAGIEADRHQGRWVVTREILGHLEQQVATLRLRLEASLSQGLPNTPLHGVELSAVSGNLVMAKPLGVRHGVDFLHGGEVRRVRSEAIQGLLSQQAIVVLPPLGYSSTGEVFDLDAAEVAEHAAVALAADKLILLGEGEGLFCEDGELLRQLNPEEAALMAPPRDDDSELSRHLAAACGAARRGVGRTHLLSWRDRDALLGELFTRDGIGTMITRQGYEQLRKARLEDVGGLLALLGPLEQRGILVARSRERLEHEIDDYVVLERDGMVIGCAALHLSRDAAMGELACVAVHDDYRRGQRGEQLLAEIELRARRAGVERLYALTTHTVHWFIEHGFVSAGLQDLPPMRREAYNSARNSKVLLKSL